MPGRPEREKGLVESTSLLREQARMNVRLRELRTTNLNFLKPRARWWLKIGLEFPLEEVLTDEEAEMVRFYLGLDEGDRMHSLVETAAFLGRPSKSKEFIGKVFRNHLIKLKRRELVGPEAVETLKLPDQIYNPLVKRRLVRVGDISKLSEEQLREVCGNDWGLSLLQRAMQEKGIDFAPEVEFPLFPYERK